MNYSQKQNTEQLPTQELNIQNQRSSQANNLIWPETQPTTNMSWETKDEIDRLSELGQTEKTYTYDSDFQNYSIAFRNRKDNKFQMAVASYNTDSMNNQVDIIDLGFDKNGHDGFKKINEFKHEFPPTKVMWIPDVEGTRKDILATTAEYLRIWEHQEETNTYKEHKILRNVSTLF